MNPFLKFRVATVSIVLLLIVVVGYGFFRSYDLIHGITLTVSGIPEDGIAHDPYLPLSGKAKNAVLLSLDGRPITVSKAGDWQDAIILSKGYNVISILARDKFGKETKQDYQVMLNELE